MRIPVLHKEFNTYKIFDVYQCDKGALHEKVLAMWARNGVIPKGADPEKRVRQAVLVVLDGDDNAVAVNTVYDSTLADMGVKDDGAGLFHAYRMFVEPGKSKMWLNVAMTCGAFDILESFNQDNQYRGVIIRTDNPKLMKSGSIGLLERNGWPIYGRDERGRVIARRDFQ